MAFRFRKSFRLAPGIRINLSKSGVSASVGPRGATLNVGPRGTRVTVGVPGSGLSYTTKLGQKSSRSGARRSLAPDRPRADSVIARDTFALDEDFELVVLDPVTKQPLSAQDRLTFIGTNQVAVHEWLQTEADARNSALSTVHRTPEHQDAERFGFGLPALPAKPSAAVPAAPTVPDALDVTAGASRYQRDNERREVAAYQRRHATWLEERATHLNEASQQWRAYRSACAAWRKERLGLLERLRKDSSFQCEVLAKRYSALLWPDKPSVQFATLGSSGVSVSAIVQLPEAARFSKLMFVPSSGGHRLEKRRMPAGAVADLYRDHVVACAARVIALAFATLPDLDLVIASGFRPDQEGKQECVVTMRVTNTLFVTELKALTRLPRLGALERRTWCGMQRDRAGHLEAIEPYVA